MVSRDQDRVVVGSADGLAGPLSGFESVDIWWNSARPSASWKRKSTKYLMEFCESVGKNPDELLRERRRRKLRDPHSFHEEMLLDRWHEELLKRHTPGTAQLKFTAVVSFFKYNRSGLEIPKFPSVTKDQYHGPRRLRKPEIQKMVSFADSYRMKLTLLLGAESGLRGRALSALTLGCLIAREDGTREGVPAQHWRDLENKDLPMPVRIQLPLHFYFGHNKREGITFLCKDAVDMLVQSLKDRESRGELIRPETPLLQVYEAVLKVPGTRRKVNTWLGEWHPVGSKVTRIMKRRASDGQERNLPVDCEVDRIRVRAVAEDSLRNDIKNLREQLGITHDRKLEGAPSIHSLRKYLRSTLDTANVNAVMVSTIIGHSNAVEEHYSGRKNLDLEEIREAYKSAMQRISITEDVDDSMIASLQERVKSQETVNTTLGRELVGYREMKTDMEQIMAFLKAAFGDGGILGFCDEKTAERLSSLLPPGIGLKHVPVPVTQINYVPRRPGKGNLP